MLAAGLVIAFIYLPALAAVVLACLPLLAFAAYLEFKFMMGAAAAVIKSTLYFNLYTFCF